MYCNPHLGIAIFFILRRLWDECVKYGWVSSFSRNSLINYAYNASVLSPVLAENKNI